MSSITDKTKSIAGRAKTAKTRELDQLDIFMADIVDASPKDDRASMMFPFFSVSKKKDMTKRVYHDEKGKEVLTLDPSGRGLATIWDKDILLFCMSQIMAAINRGEKISRTVKVETFSILKATQRTTNSSAYENIEDALVRLRGTTILTSVSTGGKTITKGFGFIEDFEITSSGREREVKRKDGETLTKKTILGFELTLSEWIFNALMAKEVLTINSDYFAITGGIERRLYELARKHCGKQNKWEAYINTLFKKSGVKSSDLDPAKDKTKYKNALKKFRAEIKSLVEKNTLPGYKLTYQKEKDKVTFKPR